MSVKDGPARSAVDVTPSNTVNLKIPSRALYIGVAGDVSVEMFDNVDEEKTQVFTAVPVGILPVQVTRVNLTGTAATDIKSLY